MTGLFSHVAGRYPALRRGDESVFAESRVSPGGPMGPGGRGFGSAPDVDPGIIRPDHPASPGQFGPLPMGSGEADALQLVADRSNTGLLNGRRSGRLPFSIPQRTELFPGEDEFFRKNPGVAGMAAEDGSVILNPYTELSETEREAVARNEAARVWMRESGIRPSFEITEEQRRQFVGTPYGQDEQAMRETIAARLFSGDPSGGSPTREQEAFVDLLRQQAQHYGE